MRWIVCSRAWEWLILFASLAAGGIALMERPANDTPQGVRIVLDSSVRYATYGFSVELGLWVFGMGIGGRSGLLRNGWRLLDLLCVTVGWLTFVSPLFPNPAPLRMLRILIPLSRVRALITSRIVVVTVARSSVAMKDVIALLLFVLALFGVTGLSLFGSSGQLYWRCGRVFVDDEYGNSTVPPGYVSAECGKVFFENGSSGFLSNSSCVPVVPTTLCGYGTCRYVKYHAFLLVCTDTGRFCLVFPAIPRFASSTACRRTMGLRRSTPCQELSCLVYMHSF